MWGRNIWELPVPFPQFCYELKASLNKNLIKMGIIHHLFLQFPGQHDVGKYITSIGKHRECFNNIVYLNICLMVKNSDSCHHNNQQFLMCGWCSAKLNFVEVSHKHEIDITSRFNNEGLSTVIFKYYC